LKAFLLAAGHGARLRPLTDKIPKCLLPIQGTPMLMIWLNVCSRFGIDEVLINIHSHADAVREFLKHCVTSVRVHIVEEEQLLGSAGTLLANREWLNGEPLFWVFYADVLHRVDLGPMLHLQQTKNPAATLAVSRVPDPTRCGIVTLTEDGTITEFIEKPRDPKSDLAFAGLLIGTETMLDAIPSAHPVDIGFDVLPRLAGRMMAYPISDYLIDIGTMENYTRAQATWSSIKEQI
jgi:mannose-1-phosphate guanylyltransferase